MKIEIEGIDMTPEDLKNVCKFFADYWKDRKDVVSIFVTKGTEDWSKEELMKMMTKVFEDRPHYTKIFEMQQFKEE